MIYPAASEIENRPSGELVAENIPWETYLADYEGHFEWVKGYVVQMSPVQERHYNLTAFLLMLFKAYFAFRPTGKVMGAPFVMQLDAVDAGRQPDLQIILNRNPGQLTSSAMIGPADICIEIVSPASIVADYMEKFREYEAAGVQEYWIIDPLRQVSDFHRLNAAGKYDALKAGARGYYTTPLLPDFKFYVPALWAAELPNIVAIVAMVQQMVIAGEK